MKFYKIQEYFTNLSEDEIKNLKSFIDNQSLGWSDYVEVVELSQCEEYDFLLKNKETGNLYTKYIKYEHDNKEGIFCYVYVDDISEYDNKTHVVYDFQNGLKMIQYRLQFELEGLEMHKQYLEQSSSDEEGKKLKLLHQSKFKCFYERDEEKMLAALQADLDVIEKNRLNNINHCNKEISIIKQLQQIIETHL